jgi:hypothetical protein
MAGSLNDYLELKLLEELTGKTAFTMPTVYIALSRADPGESGAGVDEPAIGSLGYARIQTVAANWGTAAAGAIANAQLLAYAEATGSWGVLTHWIAYDAPTGGNPLFYGTIDYQGTPTPKTISGGDTASFAIGALGVTLT